MYYKYVKSMAILLGFHSTFKKNNVEMQKEVLQAHI
jgi:hypothetical protein